METEELAESQAVINLAVNLETRGENSVVE
jgi:hypothetical protein